MTRYSGPVIALYVTGVSAAIAAVFLMARIRLHLGFRREGDRYKESAYYKRWTDSSIESLAALRDPVVVVLNTDPISVLTELALIGDDGDPGCAVVDLPSWGTELVDLTTLAMMLDLRCATTAWRLDGDAAVKIALALTECRYQSEPGNRFGHTSMAAARTLMRSGGTCDGCDNDIDLSGPDARDEVYVHTVDACRRPDPTPPIVPRAGGSHHPPPIRSSPSLRFSAHDWPAVLCRRCRDRMHDGGYRSFLDFRFDQHPACPECGGRRSLSTFYGMPSDVGNIPPWLHIGGCCVSDEAWRCDVCDHEW